MSMRPENSQIRKIAIEIANLLSPEDFPDMFRRGFTKDAPLLHQARMFEDAAKGLEVGKFWHHAQRCWDAAGQLYCGCQMDEDACLCNGLATMLSRFRHDSSAQHCPGHIINGDYVIYYARKGGMGTAYFCRDLHSDQPVVLKTYQRKDSMDPEARGKFLHECALWLRIQNYPHIVRAKEVLFDRNDKDRLYLVLEYVPGRFDVGSSLADHLRKRGGLPVETALKYAIHVCHGMNYVSSILPEFVHRDLKPDNILIGSDEVAKVIDLGISNATLLLELNLAVSLPGETPIYITDPIAQEANRPVLGPVGTLPYIPPEAWRSQKVDLRGDVYSFGCILFEMLTAQLPFPLSSSMDWGYVHTRVKPLRLVDAGVAAFPNIQEILSRCLLKTPVQRYQNFNELLRELAQCFEEVTGHQAPAPPEPIPLKVSEKVNLAISLAEVGIGSEGIELLKEVATQEPKVSSHRYNLAIIYKNMGNHEMAIEFYKEAISIDPNLSSAWYNMGASLALLGRINEAEDAWKKAAKLGHPRAQQAIDALGKNEIIIVT